MTVYIVLEEDRGIGVAVSGVYTTEAQAQAMCGGHKWVAEAMFDDSAIRKECADRAVGLLKKHRLSLQSIWSPEGYSEIALEWFERLRAAIEGRP